MLYVLTEMLSPINAENLRKAHRNLESSEDIGKIVLSGFKLMLLSNNDVFKLPSQGENLFSINTSAL